MQERSAGPGGNQGAKGDAGKRQTQLISPLTSKGGKGAAGQTVRAPAARPPPLKAAYGGPAAKRKTRPGGKGASSSGSRAAPDAGDEANGGRQLSAEDRAAAAQAAARPRGAAAAYVRPRQKQRPADTGEPALPSASIERLEAAVLCGRLWHAECRAACDDAGALENLPVSFQSAAHYIAAYEPLIFEEAREGVLQSRLDKQAVEAQATVTRLDSLAGGWSEVGLDIATRDSRVREGCVAILSSHALPPGASVDWYVDLSQRLAGSKRKRGADAGAEQAGPAFVVAGVVRTAPSPGRGGEVVVALHPRCPAHATGNAGPCAAALAEVRPGRKLRALLLPPFVTVQREFVALHKVPDMQVGECMLRPERLAQLDRELAAAHPGPPRLPAVCCNEAVMGHMRAQFDETQFGAIAAATRHCDPGSPAMPFVLICGPPGTGKTHTVTGVLNVWHLAQYTQHQRSIHARVRESVGRDLPGADARGGAMAAKPRLLVCAPSNAAADELLQRVMIAGFTGNDGRPYYPNVVRVGAPGANIGEAARAVLVDGLVQALLDAEPRAWQAAAGRAQAQLAQLGHIVHALQAHLADLEVPEEPGPAREQALRQEDEAVRQLVERLDARARLLRECERLALVSDHVHRRPGAGLASVREAVERLFIEDAEMVFTTLSSTGRRVFSKLPPGHFETVLIDEAAQASEVTSLQALAFGCRRVVLVGDPQQLPATILSQRGRELLLERSLFERLQQAGCPVSLLQVQYRMHPAIRAFPSAHFYQGRLRDGQSVLDRPPEVFYRHRLLQPYLFFDVAGGFDVVSGGSGSRRNQAEADLAAALFQALRAELLAAVERQELRGPVVVGVITPYREQVACIQATLRAVLGPQLAAEVSVATVDSYQGRQLDAIILSCVRAAPGTSGVGFVADTRRMNVSITRAKKALWVLGSAATLRCSPVWQALLADAGARGLLVPDASARSLFPHLPQFQPGFRPLDGSAHAPAATAPAAAAGGGGGGRRKKQGPGMSDQMLQDGQAAAAAPPSMMEQLELGASDGIPGLGPAPDAPRLQAAGSSTPAASRQASREASRAGSPSDDESHLYGEARSGGSTAAASASAASAKTAAPGAVAGAEPREPAQQPAATPQEQAAELEPGEIEQPP